MCLFFEHNIFAADKEIYNLQFLITNNKYSNKFNIIKPRENWNMGLHQGSANRFEGDCNSDLKCLDSAILGNVLL